MNKIVSDFDNNIFNTLRCISSSDFRGAEVYLVDASEDLKKLEEKGLDITNQKSRIESLSKKITELELKKKELELKNKKTRLENRIIKDISNAQSCVLDSDYKGAKSHLNKASKSVEELGKIGLDTTNQKNRIESLFKKIIQLELKKTVNKNISNAFRCESCQAFTEAEFYLDGASKGVEELKEKNEDQAIIQDYLKEIEKLRSKMKKAEIKKVEVVDVREKTLFSVRVTYDAGFGNTIELRGSETAGLSWKQGKTLICKDANHWELDLEIGDIQESFEYKLVLHKANGKIVWEKTEGDKNRVFSFNSKDDIDSPELIVPVFEEI